MITPEQARGRIRAAINRWRAAVEPGQPPRTFRALAQASGVTTSMLYQYLRPDGPVMGRSTVSALRPLLDVDSETWLAAMGVEREDIQQEAAQ